MLRSGERLGQKTLAHGELARGRIDDTNAGMQVHRRRVTRDLVDVVVRLDREGFYTDPENHPGGTRKITVDDGTIGVFRQAWIDGGGGEGEPESYTLPALVKGDRIIARPRRPKGCSCDAAHGR